MGGSLPHTLGVSSDASSLQDLQNAADAEEQRICRLISRPRAARAEPIWSDDIYDPEFQKNLRMLGRLVAGVIGLCGRSSTSWADPAQASALIARSAELRRRLVLPGTTPLTLPVLLGHRFALEFLLVELGDETYIRMRAAELYGESEGTIVTWKVMYAHPPPLLVDGVQPGDTHDARPQKLHATREMVRQLLAAKEAQDLPARARRTLKTRVLTETVLPGVMIAALIFAAVLVRYRVIMLDTLGPVLAAAVTGAVLGQFRKLRDEVRRGSQVREFVPLFFGQALVGFITGLFVALAASQLSILNLADPRTLPALAFGAGFSEAAFLGLVSKLIGDASTDARDGTDGASERTAERGSST